MIVVFNNARFGSGSEFMMSLENNVLEPKIYDIVKEELDKIRIMNGRSHDIYTKEVNDEDKNYFINLLI